MRKIGRSPKRSSYVKTLIQQAKEVLEIEAQGILNLLDKVGEDFVRAVESTLNLKGRVIVTGIGKSGIVARKVAATLSSTGTPALFLHPTEAMHGDLGMVTSEDMVLAISNSGETRELNILISSVKKMGTKLIAFTGNLDSTLAKNSDIVVDVGVEREACPLGLAPTASTTAALAMGDALAVALINKRRLKAQDFFRYHPGGELGVRASLEVKVGEVMLKGKSIPTVSEASKLDQAIKIMDERNLGATLVINRDGALAGMVTDGDLRRALKKHKNIHKLKVCDIMEVNLKTINEDYSAFRALEFMERHGITVLPIVDKSKRVKGILHLNYLLGREDFRSHI